jgi:hypothetical protein
MLPSPPMVAGAPLVHSAPPPPPPAGDHRVCIHGVSWKDYLVVRDVLDGPGVRMTYLEGALEIMSASPAHELWKTNIARLVELYAHVKRVPLHGYGSATFKKEAKERGTEPEGAFTLYSLDRATGGYVVCASSALVPGLDFAAVARYAVREDTPQALWEFEAEIKG